MPVMESPTVRVRCNRCGVTSEHPPDRLRHRAVIVETSPHGRVVTLTAATSCRPCGAPVDVEWTEQA